ncbi:MAG: fibronectin type III domain-containing protein [Nitrospirae bacterium]|nr:fibronectin type III domain-containing protein [Nitrospirota bacterium]
MKAFSAHMPSLFIYKCIFRARRFLIVFLLVGVCCFFFSCGKRGDPTLKSYEKPPPPAGLRAIHRETEILLMWDFPKDKEPIIKAFHLMKSKNKDFERIAIPGSDRRSYIERNFETGIEYKYKINSQNLKGIISNDSNILAVIPADTPSPPGKISYEVKDNFLILNWKSVEEQILYNVYKSYEKGIYGLIPVNKEPLKETSFRDAFDITRAVYYTVRSLRGSDIRDEGMASEEINIEPSEFIPSMPAGIQAIAREIDVYIIWQEPPETWISGYRIYRKTEADKDYTLIGETQVPAFIDNDKPLTFRNYRVSALGPVKEGPPAEIKNVIFTPLQ